MSGGSFSDEPGNSSLLAAVHPGALPALTTARGTSSDVGVVGDGSSTDAPGTGTADDTTVPAGGGRLADRSVKGFLWLTVSFGLTKLVILALTLVLARVLDPADFGVVTAGLTVITFLDGALDLGVGAAVVFDQERGRSHRVRTAASITLALSAAIAIAGIVSARLTAELFDARGYSLLFAVLYVYPLLRGAGQISDALLRRELSFRRRASVDVVRAVVRVAVSIPLALAGAGPWSIALGILASEAGALVLLTILEPVWPTRRLGRNDLRELVAFGGRVTTIRVLGSWRTNVDYLVVGHVLGIVALGFYGIAYRLPELLVANVLWIFSSVAFPAYASARSRGTAPLRSAMLRATRLVTLYGAVAGVGLAVVARDAVPILFSARWQPAVVPMELTSLSLAAMSVGWASGDVFPAIGRAGVLLWLDIPATIAVTFAFVESTRWGITGVAVVHLAFNAAYAAVRAVMAVRVTGVTGMEMLCSLLPGGICAAGVAAAALAVGQALPRAHVSTLLAECGAGALAGLLIAAVTARPAILEVLRLARPARANLRTASRSTVESE